MTSRYHVGLQTVVGGRRSKENEEASREEVKKESI